MSSSNWRFSPPLGTGLICVALFLIAGLSNHQDNCQRRYQTAQEHSANAHYCVLGFAFRAPLQAPPRNEDPKRDEWRQERDLEAQWATANWTLGTFITSILGLIVAGAGVYYVSRTLHLQYEANVDARQRFDVERRAWLDVEFKVDRVFLHNEDFWFTVTLTARNVGQSPATHVLFDIPREAAQVFIGEDYQAFRRRIEADREIEWVIGETVFQGGSRERSGVVHNKVSRGDVLGRDFVVPVFVAYSIASDKKRHVTPVIIQVRVTKAEMMNVSVVAEHHPMSLAPN